MQIRVAFCKENKTTTTKNIIIGLGRFSLAFVNNWNTNKCISMPIGWKEMRNFLCLICTDISPSKYDFGETELLRLWLKSRVCAVRICLYLDCEAVYKIGDTFRNAQKRIPMKNERYLHSWTMRSIHLTLMAQKNWRLKTLKCLHISKDPTSRNWVCFDRFRFFYYFFPSRQWLVNEICKWITLLPLEHRSIEKKKSLNQAGFSKKFSRNKKKI